MFKNDSILLAEWLFTKGMLLSAKEHSFVCIEVLNEILMSNMVEKNSELFHYFKFFFQEVSLDNLERGMDADNFQSLEQLYFNLS